MAHIAIMGICMNDPDLRNGKHYMSSLWFNLPRWKLRDRSWMAFCCDGWGERQLRTAVLPF